MHLKILGHPIFVNLNFHMPMIVDLSHPLVMLQGENGAGKSTLLHSIFYALRGDQVENYVYRLEPGDVKPGKAYLFDAEQHNPRTQLELFKEQPEMVEFLRTASHGQVMLSLFRETFPKLPAGTEIPIGVVRNAGFSSEDMTSSPGGEFGVVDPQVREVTDMVPV